MVGTTGWERALVSSHGINALLSPSWRLPYKDTWMLTYDGRGSTQHCHWVCYTFLYQHLDTQLQTHILPPYHKNQMSEENRWKLLTTAWRFPRTDQWLRESQLIKVLSPIILLQDISINKSKLLHKAPMQVPAEAFAFSGTLSFRNRADVEQLPLDKPVMECLFRSADRISYFH